METICKIGKRGESQRNATQRNATQRNATQRNATKKMAQQTSNAQVSLFPFGTQIFVTGSDGFDTVNVLLPGESQFVEADARLITQLRLIARNLIGGKDVPDDFSLVVDKDMRFKLVGYDDE